MSFVVAAERCQTDRVAAEPHALLQSQDTGRPRAPSPVPPAPGRRVGCGPQPPPAGNWRRRWLQVRKQETAEQEPVRMAARWENLIGRCPLA